MKALWYVTKRSMVNQIKKAIKKPVTYLILAVALLYVFLFGSFFIGWRESGSFTSERSLVTILTVGTVFTFFSNFVTYAKKKGIIFKPSHAHFIFTAPINPKVMPKRRELFLNQAMHILYLQLRSIQKLFYLWER